ncbi:MAG: hypothetical protein WED00_08790 [Aquisalimonadaceae bacterium]
MRVNTGNPNGRQAVGLLHVVRQDALIKYQACTPVAGDPSHYLQLAIETDGLQVTDFQGVDNKNDTEFITEYILFEA